METYPPHLNAINNLAEALLKTLNAPPRTRLQRFGFRLKIPARGVRISSRRRIRVWLEECEPIVANAISKGEQLIL